MGEAIISRRGGGIKKIGVTVNGAIGEKITYSGEASGSVTLNSKGTGTISNLPVGTYTFTGSVSGYSKTVTFKDSGTVNVFPDGAMYWYGNGDSSGETLFSKSGGMKLRYWHTADATDTQLTYGGTYISFNTYNSGGGGTPKMVFPANKTNLSGKTKFHAIIKSEYTPGDAIRDAICAFADADSVASATATPAARQGYGSNLTTPTEVTLDVSSLSGEYDLCVGANSSRSQTTTTVYAIWVT